MSGVSINSAFIVEIVLKKRVEVKDMLFYLYRSFKRMSSYIRVNGSIKEAAAVVTINIIKVLNISVIIYIAFVYL